MRSGRSAEAEDYFLKGRDARQKMLEDFPDSRVTWKTNLAGAYHHMAWAQSYLGKYSLALENQKKSHALYIEVFDEFSAETYVHNNLSISYRWLAEIELIMGLTQSAMQNISQSLSMHADAIKVSTNTVRRHYQSCASAVTAGEIAIELNRIDEIAAILDSHCPEEWGITEPTHFKYLNRLLAYRRALIELELAYRAGDTTWAYMALEHLKDNLWREEQKLSAMSPELELLKTGVEWIELRLGDDTAPYIQASFPSMGADRDSAPIADEQIDGWRVDHPLTRQINRKIARYKAMRSSARQSR